LTATTAVVVLRMRRRAPHIKLAISIDPAVHARVVRMARADGTSISAWMTEAARRALRVRDGIAAVREWEAEHGALTSAEMNRAREAVRRKHGARPQSRGAA